MMFDREQFTGKKLLTGRTAPKSRFADVAHQIHLGPTLLGLNAIDRYFRAATKLFKSLPENIHGPTFENRLLYPAKSLFHALSK